MIAHPSPEVNEALVRLNDALCTWERNTLQESVLIVRMDGWSHRSMSGKPVADCLSDAVLLATVHGGAA